MRSSLPAVALTLGATLGLAACSGGSSPDGGAVPAPSSTDASSAASATAGPDPASPSPSALPTLPAQQCLTGRYALLRFVAVGGETYGTGEGGDVTVVFGDGRYTLRGAGATPMVVTVGGQAGNLTVDGASTGTYRLTSGTATFAGSSATGGGRLSSPGGDTQKLTMKQVNSVIGLAGDGQVACTDQAMTITLNAIRLELGRV